MSNKIQGGVGPVVPQNTTVSETHGPNHTGLMNAIDRVGGPGGPPAAANNHQALMNLIDTSVSTQTPTNQSEVLALINTIDLGAAAPHFQGGGSEPFSPETSGERELRRLERQDGRIQRGDDRGNLTTKEWLKLERQQMRIGNAIIDALGDGRIDAAEQAKIDAMQDRANVAIYRERHDKQGKGGRFEERSKRQQERIDNGVSSGALTRAEERKLEKQAKKIDRVINEARADGKVTEAEARRIERLQDRQSERIYDQKHDKQRR